MSRSGHEHRWGGVARSLILLLVCGPAPVLAGEVSMAIGDDDNLSNAPDNVPALDSTTYSFGASADWFPHFEQRTGLRLGLSAQAQNVRQHSGLSHAGLGASASGWWIVGGSFSAPTVYLDLAAETRDFQSRERDQTRLLVGLSLVQRLTTQISWQLGAGLRSTEAEGPAFDGDMLRYGLGLRWQPLPRASLDLQYEERDGDVAVSVDRFFSEVNRLAETVQSDDALPGYRAYRVESEGSGVTLGLNWRWTEAAHVRVHAAWVSMDSKRNLFDPDDQDGPGPGPEDPGPGPSPGPDDGDSGLDTYPSYERLRSGLSLTVRF